MSAGLERFAQLRQAASRGDQDARRTIAQNMGDLRRHRIERNKNAAAAQPKQATTNSKRFSRKTAMRACFSQPGCADRAGKSVDLRSELGVAELLAKIALSATRSGAAGRQRDQMMQKESLSHGWCRSVRYFRFMPRGRCRRRRCRVLVQESIGHFHYLAGAISVASAA